MFFHSRFKAECVHEFNFRAEIASFQYPFLLFNDKTLAILAVENNNVVSDRVGVQENFFPLSLSVYCSSGLHLSRNFQHVCRFGLEG